MQGTRQLLQINLNIS